MKKMTLEEATALLPAAALITVYHDVPAQPFREDTTRDEVLSFIAKSEERALWSGQPGEMLMLVHNWRRIFVDIGRMPQAAPAPPVKPLRLRLRKLLLASALGGMALGVVLACGLEWMTGGSADPRCAMGVPGYVPRYSLATNAKEDRVTCVHKVIPEPK